MAAMRNPQELLIFNPQKSKRKKKNAAGVGNHKPGCKCTFCTRARDIQKKVAKMPTPIRRVFDRNARPFAGWKHFTKSEQNLLRRMHLAAPKDASEVQAMKDMLRKIDEINRKYATRNPGNLKEVLRDAKAMAAKHGRIVYIGRGKDGRYGFRFDSAYPAGSDIKTVRKIQPKRGNPRRRRRDRNPEPSGLRQAVKLFESFHGKEPKEIAELQVSAAVRRDYSCLGDLFALGLEDGGLSPAKLATRWREVNHIGFEGDKVRLASAPNGKQLYIIGGSQDLSSSLRKWEGVDASKDFIDLGDVYFVTYLARKIHDNYEPVEYTHRFGEEGGTLPRLMYDQIRKQLFLVGGEYFIDMKEISPGIEN